MPSRCACWIALLCCLLVIPVGDVSAARLEDFTGTWLLPPGLPGLGGSATPLPLRLEGRTLVGSAGGATLRLDALSGNRATGTILVMFMSVPIAATLSADRCRIDATVTSPVGAPIQLACTRIGHPPAEPEPARPPPPPPPTVVAIAPPAPVRPPPEPIRPPAAPVRSSPAAVRPPTASVFLPVPPAREHPGDVIPHSSRRGLSRAFVEVLDRKLLWLARNEIYARHGLRFVDRELARHFAARPWYRPVASADEVERRLSAVERANVALLQDEERRRVHSGIKPGTSESRQMVLPHSSQQLIAAAELGRLTREELSLARNEIFARHGHVFVTPALARHFAACRWYRPRAPISMNRLSAIESANVKRIGDEESVRANSIVIE